MTSETLIRTELKVKDRQAIELGRYDIGSRTVLDAQTWQILEHMTSPQFVELDYNNAYGGWGGPSNGDTSEVSHYRGFYIKSYVVTERVATDGD